MVTVRFHEDSRQRLSSIVAEGHAGWAESGDDIVCAAVSAILQAAWLGLTEHAHVKVAGERTPGALTMRWPADARDREDVRAIVETARLSVHQIGRQFPEHVRAERVSDEV